jgi:hypothetical protein
MILLTMTIPSPIKKPLNAPTKIDPLYEPTIAALRWSRSRIQSRTIIFADEYFAFGGRTDRGEALAIKEFLQENPEISLRQMGFYGAGGAVFIVSANSY